MGPIRPAFVPGAHVLGRYRIYALLGQGSSGAVYAAFDTASERDVALKRLWGGGANELRFRREFHTLASLRHPAIVQAYDYGVDESWGPVYTMELLGGEDLRDVLANASTAAPIARICSLLRDIASALALLHGRGLVHRDLSLRNIRCANDGRAKLIDFGTLANAGSVHSMIGTPGFIAPELARERPIDGRADLFSLGCIAYVLLARHYPYPPGEQTGDASDSELEAAWRREPPAPSRYRADVPPALDALVMDCVRIEPLARPVSAAEVIDRLTAIGGLAGDDALAVARGYLASSVMVGRDEEAERVRAQFRECVEQTKVRSVVIEAASGMGKTRLIEEAILELKLKGACVAVVRCESEDERPYGVVQRLMEQIGHRLPDVSATALAGVAPRLARVLPDLRPGTVPAPEAKDAFDERIRVQRALADYFARVSRYAPVAVVVDDAQRADEASAALLAMLRQQSDAGALFVLLGIAAGEPVRAETAIAGLRASADARLALAGLGSEEIEKLLASLFGGMRNRVALAGWMQRLTGGSPLYCTELARSLVEDGVVRYQHGEWLAHEDLDRLALPGALAEMMQRRVERLSPNARKLANVLSVHGGEIPLELCHALGADLGDAEALFAALHELTQSGVLLERDSTFRFRHDGLRQAVLRGLDAEQRRALHRTVGSFLVASAGFGADREAEAGWHLLHGGLEREGAELLERAGRRLFAMQALRDCIAPLEAALHVRKEHGDPMAQRMALHEMLLRAGWMADRETSARHALATVDALSTHLSMDLATELQRRVGGILGMTGALAHATARWWWRNEEARGPSPIAAIARFGEALCHACAVASSFGDRDEVLRVRELALPFARLGVGVPEAVHLIVETILDLHDGQYDRGRRRVVAALAINAKDRLSDDETRRLAEAGLLGLRVLIDLAQLDPQAEADMARMDQLGFHYYRLFARSGWVSWHRIRGEEAAARALEAELDAEAVHIGGWAITAMRLTFAHPLYGFYGDVLGLRRTLAELDACIAAGMDRHAQRALAQGSLLCEEGDHLAAVVELERGLASVPPPLVWLRQWFHTALAETRWRMNDHAGALAQADAALALTAGERGNVIVEHRAKRLRALALAALGRTREAVALLERNIRETSALGSPALAGLYHEARARVASMMDDEYAYGEHVRSAAEWIRPTGNPALMAKLERLAHAHSRNTQILTPWRGERNELQTQTKPSGGSGD